MFIGRYYHTLEEKGRVSIPKTFRSSVGEWVITRGLDGGIYLFPASEFEKELQKLATRTFTRKDDRDFVRYLANDATLVEVDDQGRVLVPEYLKTFANLTKQVVLVGSYSYVELWDVDTYHSYLETLETTAVEIAERINE